MTPGSNPPSLSVQEKIESIMQVSQQEGRWESIYLFSSEGLLLAGSSGSRDHSQDRLLEFAFSLIETTALLEKDLPVKEVTIRSKTRAYMVFRYFHAWDDALILAAVVRGRKGYKRAMSGLMKYIQEL